MHVTDFPLAAASPFQSIAEKVSAYLEQARIVAEDGLTWREFGELLLGLLRISIETLDATSTLSGPEKKELVLEAAAALFDQLADRCVPMSAWPVWIVIWPAIRSLVLAIAAGAVEQILPLVRLAR